MKLLSVATADVANFMKKKRLTTDVEPGSQDLSCRFQNFSKKIWTCLNPWWQTGENNSEIRVCSQQCRKTPAIGDLSLRKMKACLRDRKTTWKGFKGNECLTICVGK